MGVVVCSSSCFYSSFSSLPSTEIQCKRKSKKQLLFGPVKPPKRFSSPSIYAVNTSSTQESIQSVEFQPKDPFTNSALEQLDIERGVCIPFRKYSPESVKNKVLESRGAILSLIGRGVEIVWNLGLYWTSLVYDYVVGRDQEVVPFRARQLRQLLCDLGPSFIKAGQVLANRPDIIREDYMKELCILQDDVPPFPNQVAFNIIEEELGQPLEAVFSKISSGTIAAASLGQVYRATLRATGEDVAIKVLRPEIEPIIYRDLFLFRTLASFLNGISLQKLGCNAELIVDEFGEKLLEELDYTLEARNIEDFLENFKNDPTVKIPQVYKKLSGPRVLVMEWIDGVRCTDPEGIKEAGIDIDGFLTVGVSAALRQLLEFGLFHGDPHPGNIFAMRDGRIAYVDFGNVAVLSQEKVVENSVEKVLEKAAMANRTVIITTLNAAWTTSGSLFDLFLESFRIGNQTEGLLKHLVVVALDKTAYARCRELHPHCYALSTDGVDFSGEANFMTEHYLKMMWRRFDFLREVLEMGYSFIFTDADIMWLRQPFSQFYPDTDFQIACDQYGKYDSSDLNNYANSGFYYVKSNNRSIQFYKFWYKSRDAFPGKNDQDVVNVIKSDPFIKQIGLKIRFLNTAYIGGFCEPRQDLNLVCTMHANCCVGLGSKTRSLKMVIDDWKKYMGLASNEKTSKPRTWTVPRCG